MGRRVPLKFRVEHDHNFIMKVLSEVGDMARYCRELKAEVLKLKRKVRRIQNALDSKE